MKREREEEKERDLMSLLIRVLILSDQGPILMTLFNLNDFLRGSIFKSSHIGLRASTYEF